jgi:hypothetical protein
MPSEEFTADLTYRPMREDEVQVAADLYDLAGWGPVEAEWIRQWCFEGPLGPSLVMVAVKPHGAIVGMLIFSPMQVQLFDRVGIACRGRAAILLPEFRFSARQERGDDDEFGPILVLSQTANEHIDARGWEFHLGLPHPRMQARMEQHPLPPDIAPPITSSCSFAGVKIEFVDVPAGPIPLEVSLRTPPFPPEYDDLWRRARLNLDIECAVLRNAEGLDQARGSQPTLECRHPRTHELLGYATFTDKREAKLQDILAVDGDALVLVAESTANWLRVHHEELELDFASALVHPTYAAALDAAGAYEIDWPFMLYLESYRPEPRPELDAERWYVATGD